MAVQSAGGRPAVAEYGMVQRVERPAMRLSGPTLDSADPLRLLFPDPELNATAAMGTDS
ncbi:MAG: hypothetical protein KJN63_10195 [Acidimicrobiia bacterium]|nr:hypothetical protein [Acidimicrobiia bacterium]